VQKYELPRIVADATELTHLDKRLTVDQMNAPHALESPAVGVEHDYSPVHVAVGDE